MISFPTAHANAHNIHHPFGGDAVYTCIHHRISFSERIDLAKQEETIETMKQSTFTHTHTQAHTELLAVEM